MSKSSSEIHEAVAVAVCCAALLLAAVFTSGGGVKAAGASFTDPSATLRGDVHRGELVYIGPFAALIAEDHHKIEIGNESNIQDSVMLEATKGDIVLGEMTILAHGATVKGKATLGEGGKCFKPEEAHCPSFVGFNSEVDGAVVEKDAMVTHLARVAPGVTIKSGFKVLPGKNVTTQAEADTPALGKVAALVQGDRDFMNAVIHVNVEFAAGYTKLAAAELSGINVDPDTSFNLGKQFPTLAGTPVQDGSFRNRIIGAVLLSNTLEQLDAVMGSKDSLRADEGSPFIVGTIAFMGSHVTFHALEHSGIQLGGDGRYESQSLVHGGQNLFNSNTTTAGFGFRLGAKAVFFNSRIGALGRVGFKSAVLGTDFGNAPGVRVGDCKIIDGGIAVGDVEWCY